MSARIPPGFAEAWMWFTVANDPEVMFVGTGIDLTTGVTATVADTDAICGNLQTSFRPFCSSDCTIGPGHVIWGQDGGDVRIDATIATLAGTNAAGSAPNNTATLVRKLSASGGRRGRGRMYVPCPERGAVNANGSFVPAEVTTLQTAANGLLSTLVGLAQVDAMVILHQTAPFTPTVVTDLVVQSKVATQRRRMRP